VDITEGIERSLNIKWEGEKMQQMEETEYFSTVKSVIANIDTAINNRVQKESQVYYQTNQTVVGKKECNDNIKMGIYKTLYLRTLLSGSESWIMIPKHESKITGTVIRYVRKCVGKARRDRIRNSHIRGVLNQEPVTKMVDGRELRWLGAPHWDG
jgi:hypothetical protein